MKGVGAAELWAVALEEEDDPEGPENGNLGKSLPRAKPSDI